MLLSLAACGGKAPDKVKDSYPGTWELDHVVIDGAEFTLSELEALREDGFQIRMVLKEGGKAYAAEGSYGDIVDWSETESGILMGDMELIMEEGFLRMESDDELWYFRKVSDSQLIEKPTEPVNKESPTETVAAESGDTEPTLPEVIFSADAEPVDGEVYVSEDFEFVQYTDGSIALTKYIGNETSVDIYQEIAGYPVSRIGAGAFEDCAFVESIYLWAKVIEIGEGAFRNCEKLESFDVPSTVTIIADSTLLVDGMRPEFKEAMDAYEAFYDEYCDFMVSYQKNPTDMKLIAQYGQLMTKMAEVNEAFEKWDESELNNEELKYYLEVSNRVMQKLVDVTG